MKLTNILIGTALLSTTSCSYNFDISCINAEKRLVAYCFPGNGDTTLIQLSPSVPLQSDDFLISGVSEADISFSVNGDSKPVERLDPTAGPHFFTTAPCKPGDQIQLSAHVKNLPTVTSSTSIPELIILNNITLKLGHSNTTKCVEFQINFTDHPDRKDYYAIRIETKLETWENDTLVSSYIYAQSIDTNREPLLKNSTQLDDLFMPTPDQLHDIYIWDDTNIQGKDYTLKPGIYYWSDQEDTWDEKSRKYIYKYRVNLYTFSEAFYRYLKSVNEINNNQLGDSDLAPKRPSYTNIENGFGVLGGYSLIQSEWLDNI